MKKLRKKNTKLFILILLLLLGIGFAALAANLKIDGTVSVHKVNWDVHFENVEVTQGSVAANPAPTSDNETTREMNYAIRFSNPGDFYEFTVDIVNGGTINAMLNLMVNKVYETGTDHEINLPAYLTNTVTYIDGTPIQKDQILKRGKREKIKVRIEFKTDVDPSDLPKTGDESVEFKFEEDYKQADNTAKDVRADFVSSSWADIIDSYDNGYTLNLENAMASGTTREIQLDLDGDGTPETTKHLRIANMNAPHECSQPDFSRSACGLVLEFVDIISLHRMNPYTDGRIDGDGNYGGWEHSEMRDYLNSTVYNALPPELKSRIVDTPVISGHGPRQRENFYTNDKLYLFSPIEIWGDQTIHFDTAGSQTRQADYYHDVGVTIANPSGAKKKLTSDGSYYFWWLRTPTTDMSAPFSAVADTGGEGMGESPDEYGASPAFRIG